MTTFQRFVSAIWLLFRAEQAEPYCITLILVKVKHKTDAPREPDMWCMKQKEKKERRESGAGCGDLKL